MEIIDTGHEYRLLNLDGEGYQVLRFVKRKGEKFPRNLNSYPGTTTQGVIRCSLERTRYVQSQTFAVENLFITLFLSLVLWLLEFRAARRHGIVYFHTPRFAEDAPTCCVCSHTVCRCEKEPTK